MLLSWTPQLCIWLSWCFRWKSHSLPKFSVRAAGLTSSSQQVSSLPPFSAFIPSTICSKTVALESTYFLGSDSWEDFSSHSHIPKSRTMVKSHQLFLHYFQNFYISWILLVYCLDIRCLTSFLAATLASPHFPAHKFSLWTDAHPFAFSVPHYSFLPLWWLKLF